MHRSLFRVVPLSLLLAAACALTACERSAPAPGPLAMDDAAHETWEIALVEMRIDKNEEFADSTRTPLPTERLAGFEGLSYYFPAPALVFRTPLRPAAGPGTATLVKRRGQQVAYRERGTVSFRHDGQVHTLTVFGPADTAEGDYLWLPFYDETTGTTTYAGGRYLDLTLDADGTVLLDFNYAYNPLCDYNAERYNCTLPPPGSRLSFAVEAGEMAFSPTH